MNHKNHDNHSGQVSLVLLVDDEANFREIFSTKLSAAGFRVETAVNGEEGLKRAKELHPDLILMDVQMPGINGVETLLKIKEDAELSGIKVLFLTALGEARADLQEIDRRFSKEMGAVGYLRKGEDLDSAVEYIKHFLK